MKAKAKKMYDAKRLYQWRILKTVKTGNSIENSVKIRLSVKMLDDMASVSIRYFTKDVKNTVTDTTKSRMDNTNKYASINT